MSSSGSMMNIKYSIEHKLKFQSIIFYAATNSTVYQVVLYMYAQSCNCIQTIRNVSHLKNVGKAISEFP